MRERYFAAGVVVTLLALAMVPAANAQAGRTHMQKAIDLYQERIEGIDNYTLIYTVMGQDVRTYYEKQVIDGRPVFVEQDAYSQSEQDDIGEFYNVVFVKIADRAKSSGTETVDGYECHVVYVDDFSGVEFDEEGEGEDFTPKKGTFYLDSEDYVIRKMVLDGETRTNGETKPVTMTARFQDYRNVDGMLHPFRTEMAMSGAAADISEEELEQARKQLEEAKKRIEEMPESQRKMVEGMMKSQLEQLEQIVNSGEIRFAIEVKELRVNSGPPEGS